DVVEAAAGGFGERRAGRDAPLDARGAIDQAVARAFHAGRLNRGDHILRALDQRQREIDRAFFGVYRGVGGHFHVPVALIPVMTLERLPRRLLAAGEVRLTDSDASGFQGLRFTDSTRPVHPARTDT